MKNIRTGVYTHTIDDTFENTETYNFEFCTDLSAYNKLVFVRSVVDTLVDEESYDYIIKDLIFDFCIIKTFTNIDTSFINVKDEDGNLLSPIIFIERFLEETNVVDIVKANMEIGLLEELNDSVNKSLQYRTGIAPSPLSDSLSSLLSTLERKIEGVDLDSMMSMAQKFAGMTGELTPENIMNAYINSDMHKKNLAEITEAKKNRAEIAENLDKAIKEVNAENKTESAKKSGKGSSKTKSKAKSKDEDATGDAVKDGE